MIQSFLEIKYPYNQLSSSHGTWISYSDLWKLILAMEKLNEDSIENIIKTDYDKDFLNFKGYYCFTEILNNYYFSNWKGSTIDELKDTTIILLFRLVILSCTKGKIFKDIKNPLEKIRCKNNIFITIERISVLHANIDRLTRLYIDASKNILPDNIIEEIRIKIMEVKLIKE